MGLNRGVNPVSLLFMDPRIARMSAGHKSLLFGRSGFLVVSLFFLRFFPACQRKNNGGDGDDKGDQ